MPTLPASWNSQTRSAATHAIAAAVFVSIAVFFGGNRQLGISGIAVVLSTLASVYLVLAAVPFTLGRALATYKQLPEFIPWLLYFGWGLFIAWTLAESSWHTLTRCVVSLPSYLDAHGFFTVAVLAVGVAAYFLVRKTSIRGADAFSLAPTASFLIALVLDSYLSRRTARLGDPLFAAELWSGATSFVATFAVLTIAAAAAWRHRVGSARRDS